MPEPTPIKRQNQIRKGRIQAGLIFFAAAMALAAQLYSNNTHEGSYSERILDKATSYYANGNTSKAVDLLEAEPNQFIRLKNGCELLIKIFDEANKTDLLENAATRCLDAEKAIGIAHEGYAKSLLIQGRAAEAIMSLEKETKKYNNPRITHAIASLYLHLKDMEGVAKYSLSTVTLGGTDSNWLAKVLETKELTENKKFISDLVQIVLKKAKTSTTHRPTNKINRSSTAQDKLANQGAKRLLHLADSLGLTNEAEKLRQSNLF